MSKCASSEIHKLSIYISNDDLNFNFNKLVSDLDIDTSTPNN